MLFRSTFNAAALDIEAAVTPTMYVGRHNQALDANVLNEIFRAKKPLPGNARIESVVTTAGDYAVYMITAVIPGRPESIPVADRDARKDELESAAGAADFSAYVSELEQRADIERSDGALQEQEFFQ